MEKIIIVVIIILIIVIIYLWFDTKHKSIEYFDESSGSNLECANNNFLESGYDTKYMIQGTETLTNGYYKLAIEADGNLVLIDNTNGEEIVWQTDTHDTNAPFKLVL